MLGASHVMAKTYTTNRPDLFASCELASRNASGCERIGGQGRNRPSSRFCVAPLREIFGGQGRNHPLPRFCVAPLREIFGGQGRNRTTDTRIFSPLLYRLSYLAFRTSALFMQNPS